MSEQINDRTAKAIKIGLRNMLESCGEMCGEDTRCLHDICPYDGDACCNESIQMGALALIEHLEAQIPRWVSMKERKPTEKDASPYGLILCVLANRDGSMSDEIRAWHWKNIVDMPECFTHWMSLPGLPKEER